MILNRRVITISVTYIVLIAVGIFFGIKPLLDGVRAKQSDLQTEYDRYHNAQAKLTQLNDLTQYKNDIDGAKNLVETAIPLTLDQDKLILSLEKMATDQNLKLNTLSAAPLTAATSATPSGAATSTKPPATTPPQVSGRLSSIVAIMDVSGTYEDVSHLLDALEKVDRIMTVTSVTITAGAGGTTNTVTATITLTAYGRSDKL